MLGVIKQNTKLLGVISLGWKSLINSKHSNLMASYVNLLKGSYPSSADERQAM